MRRELLFPGVESWFSALRKTEEREIRGFKTVRNTIAPDSGTEIDG